MTKSREGVRTMLDGLKGVEGLEMRKAVPPIAAWALSIGCTVGWGSFVMPTSSYLPNAGPAGTTIAFLFGMLAMLVIAYNYGFMAQRCSADGGVYAYAREVFGPNHAFICSWCLVLAYCSAIVANSTALALVVRSAFGAILRFGPHYVVAGYAVYFGEALSGVLAMVATAYLCIRSSRATGIVETALAIGLAAGIGGVFLLFVSSPYASFQAFEPAFSPSVSPLVGTLTVVAAVPWAYIGFEAVTQVSGECRFSAKHFAGVMGFAIICGAAMYLALTAVAAAVIPSGYANWAVYLEELSARTDAVSIPLFHAGEMLAGEVGIYLMGAAAFCAVMSGVVGFYVAATRLIYTMAVDGALNSRLARLHAVHRTPVVATMAVFVVTLGVPFVGRNVLNWIVDLMSLGALVAYLYTSIATLRYARQEANGKGRVAGLVGIMISVLCIALLVVPIPQLGTSLSKESYVILFAWIALGVNFFTPTIAR